MLFSDSPPTRYRSLPSSDDQAHPSDVHEASAGGEGGDNLNSPPGWVSVEAQIQCIYFLLGCAILLPWNALLNSTSFFLSRMTGSPFYPTFSSYMTSTFTMVKLFVQFYCTITSKQSSPSRRIFVSMIAMILLVASLCLSTYIRGTPLVFLLFALFNTAALAVSNGYLCTAVYANAAPLGSPVLQAVFSGHAAVAVAASVVQVASSIISLWGSSPESLSMEVKRADGGDDQAEAVAARIFFGISAIFLSITIVAYAWLTRQSGYRSLSRPPKQHREVEEADELTRLLPDDGRNVHAESSSRVYQVAKQNMVFMFSVAYVFAVTLAIFPAITARVEPVNPSIHPLLFTAVHFLVMNTGDFVGRYSCSFTRLSLWSAKKIMIMSLLRTLFIPVILSCNVHRPAIATSVSPIINSDILFMIIMLTLGYTNGFVSALAMLGVSSVEHNPGLKGRREDVDVAAALGGSFLNVGSTTGALLSFGVQAMI